MKRVWQCLTFWMIRPSEAVGCASTCLITCSHSWILRWSYERDRRIKERKKERVERKCEWEGKILRVCMGAGVYISICMWVCVCINLHRHEKGGRERRDGAAGTMHRTSKSSILLCARAVWEEEPETKAKNERTPTLTHTHKKMWTLTKLFVAILERPLNDLPQHNQWALGKYLNFWILELLIFVGVCVFLFMNARAWARV